MKRKAYVREVKRCIVAMEGLNEAARAAITLINVIFPLGVDSNNAERCDGPQGRQVAEESVNL